MFGWLRRKPPCTHPWMSWDILENRIDGVTLGWDARPQVYEITKIRCGICGHHFERGGYDKHDKTPRNEKGWPLNPDGSRMQLAAHMKEVR